MSKKVINVRIEGLELPKSCLLMTSPSPSQLPRPRTVSRIAATQACFHGEISGKPLSQVVCDFQEKRITYNKFYWLWKEKFFIDGTFFSDLLHQLSNSREEVDEFLSRGLAQGWSVERLEPTMRSILRLGACEILKWPQTDPRVVINEYVEIAHSFLLDKGPGFVNGVLDKLRSLALGGGPSLEKKTPSSPKAGPVEQKEVDIDLEGV